MKEITQIYEAIFRDGFELTFTGEEFDSTLAVYNHICLNRLGKGHGGLEEIRCRVL